MIAPPVPILNSFTCYMHQRVLFLDLVGHLRGAVREVIPPSSGPATAVSEERSLQIGLAQSALMCIDVLAKNLGSGREWQTTLCETLSEILELSSSLIKLTKPQPASSTKRKAAQAQAETLLGDVRLLASAFLCIGSLVRAVGAKTLPVLPVSVRRSCPSEE